MGGIGRQQTGKTYSKGFSSLAFWDLEIQAIQKCQNLDKSIGWRENEVFVQSRLPWPPAPSHRDVYYVHQLKIVAKGVKEGMLGLLHCTPQGLGATGQKAGQKSGQIHRLAAFWHWAPC